MKTALKSKPLYKKSLWERIKKNRNAYILIAPALIAMLVFIYAPIVGGFRISLLDYRFYKTSPFVGFKHYVEVLNDTFFWRSLLNTLFIGVGGLIIGIVGKVVLALLLNEVGHKWFKRSVQTIVYLPNLFSWVAIGGIWISILALDKGFVNQIIENLGGDQVNFMTNQSWIVPLFFFINAWKSVGYGCIIMLAALTGVDPHLYEAAYIDGGGRLKQIWYITLPCILNTIKVVFLLDVIAVLRIFAPMEILMNPAVENKLMVVMVYIYRRGIGNLDFDYASAAGYIVIALTMILTFSVKAFTKRRNHN